MTDQPFSMAEITSSPTPPAQMESIGIPTRELSGASEIRLGCEVETLRSRIADAETQAILDALENTNWNRKRAARLLAISYRGLLYKIRRHNIVRAKLNR
jgi:transcriptional regulator with GAF, ATPase, and Fis domain